MRDARKVAGFYHEPQEAACMESSYTIGKGKLTHLPLRPRHIGPSKPKRAAHSGGPARCIQRGVR
ncbi:hypothetical protein ASC78_10440 [Variovorax sp. Root318D1]|nr:hypothetical protein ASC78_10440 [Variovorax sp. Root318D1]